MEEKLTTGIKEGKRNRSVGKDGIHIEMMQIDPDECAKLLAAWWATVVRSGQFPQEWAEGLLCPIYRKGPQDKAESYRPVCVLSHTRKVVDIVMLAAINDRFTPAQSQFGFQKGVAITQELLQANDNAINGLQHAAILDLEKA